MMRLFLGIPVSGEARSRLERALARFRAEAPELNWAVPEDLHVTLKFIGAWPDDQEAQLIAAIEGEAWPRLQMTVAGLGAFPTLRRPSILWAGAGPREPLTAWAARVDAQLERLGVAAERRPYTPHITLARVRTPLPARAVTGAWERGIAERFGEFEADGMALFETLPHVVRGEPHYRIRHRFRQ